ncbi:MAG: alpha/beta fold hydrolase [Burkholderiales bacterium]|nr:alpha/beta fold hydrolase [Burkholderiales bacterium]
MIAGLQKWLVGLVAAALLWWTLACVQAGRPVTALLGPAVALAVYAALLGIEFALLRLRPGTGPRPALVALLRAWAGEVVAALVVFGWRQPFRSRRWPDCLPPGAQGRTGVLLVHGFMCNRGLWNRWLERLARDGVPVVAVDLEPVFGPIELYAPLIEAGIAALERCTGQPPVVVAHSMGGLALRRWWVEPGNEARVLHAITLGTPHRGTWLARFGLGFNARQMRLGSAWLRELAAAEPASRAGRLRCFYSDCDNIVFPPACAVFDGAQAQALPGVAHVRMVDRPEPWAALQRRLTP